MLEKQKEWCQEKAKKGKEWVYKNRGSICFGLGMAAMTGFYLIVEKIAEPKSAAICFGRRENEPDQAVGQVWYKDRFGTEHHFVNIDYGQGDRSGILKEICDNLNEIVYPGD